MILVKVFYYFILFELMKAHTKKQVTNLDCFSCIIIFMGSIVLLFSTGESKGSTASFKKLAIKFGNSTSEIELLQSYDDDVHVIK